MSGTMNNHRTWHGAIASYVRREVLSWPNFVTLLRACCAAAIVHWAGNHWLVAIFFAFGAASDGIDGFLAKRFGWATQFGKRFDQFADWGLGVAILYAVFVAEGLTWYNVPLLVAIGSYLTIRATRPLIDTNHVARKRTVIQYVGGVTILLSFAVGSAELRMLGYALVWSSMWLLWKSLRQFF